MLSPIDCLDTGRAIYVSHCRYAIGFIWQNIVDKEHEWGHLGMSKPARGLLFKHDWSYWPEIFAILDFIESSLHSRGDRRGQDRTRAQCARAKFQAVLKPANDFILRQDVRHFLRNSVQAPVGQF